jgi:hypothetical protein
MNYIDLPLYGGSFQYRRIKITQNYNVNPGDNYLGCDANIGAINLFLPAADKVFSGQCIVVKDEGGSCNNPLKRIFINPNGTDTIDGNNLPFSVLADYESVTLVCNGVDAWFII